MKIPIRFSNTMTLDQWCAYYTFNSIFIGLLTVGIGTYKLTTPARPGDQVLMTVLGLLTVISVAVRVHLGHLRERAAKEKE